MDPQKPLNHEFVANIRSIYRTEGEAWLARLLDVVDQLRHVWGLQNITQVPDLTYSYCFFAENAAGMKMVAKIAPHQLTLSKEVVALQSFVAGVPRVVAVSAEHSAYLMERCLPGIAAKKTVQAGDDDAATRFVAQAIGGLQGRPNRKRFKHLSEFIPSFELLSCQLSQRSLEKLRSTFIDLTGDCKNDVLLHGDLHHGNVVSHGSTWMAIDPHGYYGPPVAEIGAMIRNPWDAFPTDQALRDILDRRLAILHEELAFDRQLMNAWAYCMTALSEVWSLQDQGPSHRVNIELLSLLEEDVF